MGTNHIYTMGVGGQPSLAQHSGSLHDCFVHARLEPPRGGWAAGSWSSGCGLSQPRPTETCIGRSWTRAGPTGRCWVGQRGSKTPLLWQKLHCPGEDDTPLAPGAFASAPCPQVAAKCHSPLCPLPWKPASDKGPGNQHTGCDLHLRPRPPVSPALRCNDKSHDLL